MHSTMRRLDCTARGWLSLVQVDRSLCTTTMCTGMSSTTCAFGRRIAKGTHRNYTWRLSMPGSRTRWVQSLPARSPVENNEDATGGRVVSACDRLVALEHVPEFAERIGAWWSRGVLPHRAVDSRNHVDRLVEPRITSRLVSAHQAKVARVLVLGHHGAQLAHQFALFGIPDVMGEAGDRANPERPRPDSAPDRQCAWRARCAHRVCCGWCRRSARCDRRRRQARRKSR
ncbi:hypothetical protein ACVW0I_006649 [Bradyrhizobium sp. LM6.11]